MVTQAQADATLKFHQNNLFDSIPDLVSLSVIQDEDSWLIEAGVMRHNPEIIPEHLQIPNDCGSLTDQLLPLRVVITGEICAED